MSSMFGENQREAWRCMSEKLFNICLREPAGVPVCCVHLLCHHTLASGNSTVYWRESESEKSKTMSLYHWKQFLLCGAGKGLRNPPPLRRTSGQTPWTSQSVPSRVDRRALELRGRRRQAHRSGLSLGLPARASAALPVFSREPFLLQEGPGAA